MDIDDIWEDLTNVQVHKHNTEIGVNNSIIYINSTNYLDYFTTNGMCNTGIKEFRLEENISIDNNLYIKLYDDVIFNGQGNIIKINSSSFLGLFYLCSGSILNLNIQKGSSKLVKGNGVGWLVRTNSKGKIMNCSCVMDVVHNLAYYSAERGSKLTSMTYLDRIDYIVMK
jgi:hypothetical protein